MKPVLYLQAMNKLTKKQANKLPYLLSLGPRCQAKI